MKMSRTVAYAIEATVQLAKLHGNGPTPCSKIAAAAKMPERFLLQVLRNLVNHGIIQSVRGVEGGYTMERDPRQISLLELVEAIEGPVKSTVPPFSGLSKGAEGRIREGFQELSEAARKTLASIKVSDLIR